MERPKTPPEVRQYLDEHQIDKLFRDLLATLIRSKPDRPLEFCARVLKKIQRKRDLDVPVVNDEIIKIVMKTSIEVDSDMEIMDENEDAFDFKAKPAKDGLTQRFQKQLEVSNNYSKVRRGSVSAESLKPTEDDRTETVVIPKSDEARMRIAAAISANLLFRNLEPDQKKEVVDAMFEKKVPKGEAVIKQGEEGDNFYVVDSGKFDCLVNGKKVVEIHAGGSFGELALMYNTPRAATVLATEDSVLWAVDRITFRRCIVNNTFRKRKLYEGFLKTVDILKPLNHSEIVKVADALEPTEFEDGDDIVEQGDNGDSFYILVEGNAVVTKKVGDADPTEVKRLKAGDYFGEVALINDSPRAATVTAVGHCKCVTLDAKAFIRLLGPILDILKRNMNEYKRYEDMATAGNTF